MDTFIIYLPLSAIVILTYVNVGFLGGSVALMLSIIFVAIYRGSKKAEDAKEPVFTPTPELAALMRRQSMEDKLRYLGVGSYKEMRDKYHSCITQEQFDMYLAASQAGHKAIVYDNSDNYSSDISWGSGSRPVHYDEDDTYDNFYMQREDEYRQEYGDDYEDAIDDDWDEHQRNRR